MQRSKAEYFPLEIKGDLFEPERRHTHNSPEHPAAILVARYEKGLPGSQIRFTEADFREQGFLQLGPSVRAGGGQLNPMGQDSVQAPPRLTIEEQKVLGSCIDKEAH